MILITISIGIGLTAGILAFLGMCGVYGLCSALDDFMLKLVVGGLLPIGLILLFVGIILSLRGS